MLPACFKAPSVNFVRSGASCLNLMMFVVCCVLIWISAAAQAEELPSTRSIEVDAAFGLSTRNHLDGKVELQGISDAFSCTDRIWGVFEIQNIPGGTSEFVSHWHGPSGDVVKSKKIRTRISNTKNWFHLSSFVEMNSDAFLMNFLDPSAGFEKFIGTWNVEILRNGEAIGSGRFEVLC